MTHTQLSSGRGIRTPINGFKDRRTALVRSPIREEGGQRELNPYLQSHNLSCYRYTMATVPEAGFEPTLAASETAVLPVRRLRITRKGDGAWYAGIAVSCYAINLVIKQVGRVAPLARQFVADIHTLTSSWGRSELNRSSVAYRATALAIELRPLANRHSALRSILCLSLESNQALRLFRPALVTTRA